MKGSTQISSSRLPLLAGGIVVLIVAWQAASAASDPTPKVVVDPMTQAGADLAFAGFGRKHTPSTVIFPEQGLPLRFSHEVHLGLLECKDCHAMVNGSVRAKDVNLPPESTCLDCHDAKAAAEGKKTDPPSSCDTCHPGFTPQWLPGADFSDTHQVVIHPPATVIPEPHLKFNHKVHIDKGVQCATCHQGLDKVTIATRENSLPIMGTCLTCHDGKQAASQCKTCHITDPGGRIDTKLASGDLEPAGWYYMDAHDDNWLKSHRSVAVLGDGKCEACHTEKECIDCHNGVKKPLRIHPNDWISQHATVARKNEPSCTSCHRSQTFCVDCHQATKVVYEDPNRPPERVSFHPDGWNDSNGVRGPNHHSFQAQRNIRACASCHTEATCIACHSALPGSTGISPHPPGWTGSRDCVRMRDKNERVCYKCHDAQAQEMRCGL
ncbi:MAG: cytochrome c3 family protein [Myxococcota bacterium]